MDPLSAIGLASNIISFIDYGAKVVSGAIDIYGSSSGLTRDARSTETVVSEMRSFSSKLKAPDDAALSGDEKALCRLAVECEDLSSQIIALVEKVRPQSRAGGRVSKRASLLAGLKSKWYESDKRRLEERLSHCRAQLGLQLNYLTRSVAQHLARQVLV